MTDLRPDHHPGLAAGQDGVEVVVAGEGVASVVHDAAVVVDLAQRVDVGGRQFVEVVFLACDEASSR